MNKRFKDQLVFNLLKLALPPILPKHLLLTEPVIATFQPVIYQDF